MAGLRYIQQQRSAATRASGRLPRLLGQRADTSPIAAHLTVRQRATALETTTSVHGLADGNRARATYGTTWEEARLPELSQCPREPVRVEPLAGRVESSDSVRVPSQDSGHRPGARLPRNASITDPDAAHA
jgi:hypothetical protein